MEKFVFETPEIRKFSAIADEWWKKDGKFRMLHKINPLRIDFIKHYIFQNFPKNNQKNSFEDLNIIDIGCGGGLLTEGLAHYGGNLTGIDPGYENIEVAKLHAEKSGLKIEYFQSNVSAILDEEKKYDVAVVMEVVEHVEDLESFIYETSQILKKDGLIFFSTINRSVKSYFATIILAEYILRWLPINTHSWSKYLKPHEMDKILSKNQLKTIEYRGLSFDIKRNRWILSENLDINYFVVAKKI